MAAKDTDLAKNDDQSDGNGLDISQAAIKKMISEARARGYITYDELNKALPPEQVSSEQIEDVMSMLSEMGIISAAVTAAEDHITLIGTTEAGVKSNMIDRVGTASDYVIS